LEFWLLMTKQIFHMHVPVQPLKDYLDQRFTHRRQNGMDNEVRANSMGITIIAYRKMIHKETICWFTADRYATNLGIHPTRIWNNWYELTNREKISA
jgi:hypothetical protein